MLRGSARSLGQWRVRIFDRKFGPDFLAQVPCEPGVYRLEARRKRRQWLFANPIYVVP